MIKSNRTKRRKMKQVLDNIKKMYSMNHSNDIQIELISNENEVTPSTEFLNVLPTSTCKTNQSQVEPNSYLSEVVPIESSLFGTSNETSEMYEITEQPSLMNNTFKDDLSSWAIECNVPNLTVNKLLNIIKKYEVINTQDLPRDTRTLLATPKRPRIIRDVHPGHYYHFGLAAGIRKYGTTKLSEIEIAIGIDGLPLSKSSNGQFWPILAFIINNITKKVFPVGVYYGRAKPSDSNDFLTDFISEAKQLIVNGIVLNGVCKKVSIKVFVCDAPAKAFLLKIKGHSGFSSCTRCVQEGEYFKNRVCFPYLDQKSNERTHDTYINMLYEEHHIGEMSRLVELPGLDLVQSFSLDYMHLVCLGAVKKLILLWMHKGPLSVRLYSRNANKITSSLLDLKYYIPSDFVRRTREIQEVGRWKATELRLFLLYIGPVVLKNIVNEDVYTNFMALHVSMLILLSPDYSQYVDYSKQLLNYFVQTFEILYGRQHISHNIHGLLHLSDDYEHYGPLDNSSAFVFENFMKELKSKVRKHDKPLEQIINRYTEVYNKIPTSIPQNPKPYITSKPHTNGPLINNIVGIQFQKLQIGHIKLNIAIDKESYFLTKSREVVKCLNIVQNQNHIILIGRIFEKKNALYKNPINSKLFNIFIVSSPSKSLKYWNYFEIDKKVMLLNQNNLLISMPLIHT